MNPLRPTSQRALVVYAHPDPTSFTAAARDRAIAALQQRGADVELIDLYGEGFDPALTADEHRHHLDPPGDPDPAVARHGELLSWCDTLVLVYPTWWSAQPAILKGWFDRVWTSGVAWTLPAGTNRIRPLLRNIHRIVVITTHGSGRLTNVVEGRVGKRTVGRGLRVMCHPLARTQWRACYDMDRNSPADRERFLRQLDRL